MVAGGRVRSRTAVAVAAGALLAAGLAGYGRSRTPALAEGGPAPQPARSSSAPPAGRRSHGTFLTASQARPAVVRLLSANGSPFCSGGVVHSPGGDLVVTAAHCVWADGSYSRGTTVVPGSSGASRPYGTWRVDRVWIDPRYTDRGHEDYDYAFLRVVRDDGRSVESAAGADSLSVDRPFALSGVTVTGYPGSGDPGGRQLTCTTGTHRSAGHPRFREMLCGGYTAGVSGAPWVLPAPGTRTGALVGVIGGFNGGGPPDGTPHEDAISYSPYFDASTVTLLHRAESGTGGHAEAP